MYRYPSSITFLYYDDLMYARDFMSNILRLDMIMNQGFAAVYQISATSYLGVVQRTNPDNQVGDALVSLNTTKLVEEHEWFTSMDVQSLTSIQQLPDIPLESFFFSDREGHRFEVQQFIHPDDLQQFTQ